jgi:Predicted metal-binding, possibly nucleic acid-binding protein
MKINVSGILKGMGSRIEINDSINIPLISFKGEDIPVNSPITVKASITNTGDYLLAEGGIKAELTLECSRCTEKFNYTAESHFEEKFSNSHDKMENDEDIIIFEGDSIDLTDVVIGNLLLSLPMKYICSENCKGLCPQCGKNINTGKCDCKNEDLDPRLEVLKNFLKDN